MNKQSRSGEKVALFALAMLVLLTSMLRAGETPAPTPTPAPAVDPWERWLRDYYKIVVVPKGTEMRLGGNLARPHPRINVVMEIVQEDEHNVYLRNLPLEDPRSAGHRYWLLRQAMEARALEREEAWKDAYIIVPDPDLLVPPRFTRALEFVPRSTGLPTSGLWQMNFAPVDWNRDGRVDLVFPPARKGEPHPWVFLQQADGSWKSWSEARWPEGPSYDYGGVAVADFDGDGNLDLALACHFKPSYVLYGDGKGGFSRWVELPRANRSVTSRAVAVADFNRDGRPDIALLAELDLDLTTSESITSGLVNVVLNTPQGWKLSPATFPQGIFGDHIAVGDLDGDGYPDIVTACHKAGNPYYIFLNRQAGTSFEPYVHKSLPAQAFVFGVAVGSLDGKKPDQLIMAVYQSLRPERGEHYFSHALLAYRLAAKPGQLLPEPQRVVLYADQEAALNSFRDVAVGDLDGDGRLDVVGLRANGELVVLLQQPDGGFALEQQGLGEAGSSPSSVRIFRQGGRGYLVANFSGEGKVPGGVRVWEVHRRGRAGTEKTGKP
jgi:hypothetical protein